MPDYRKMYFKLFNRVSDVVLLLQDAQREAEEEYVSSKEPITVIPEQEDPPSD